MLKNLNIKECSNAKFKKITGGIGLASYPPQFIPPKRIIITLGEGGNFEGKK